MLVYRSIVDVPNGDPVARARSLFVDWMAEKKPGLEIPAAGRVAEGATTVSTAEASGSISAFRARMDEENDEGDTWTTTVTAASLNLERWLWLDLERVSDQPHIEGPVPRPPRLISRLLEQEECFCGDLSLSAKPAQADGGIDRLLDELFHERRQLPTIVVSNRWGEPPQGLDRLAEALAKGLAGTAHVWRLGDEATSALRERLGRQAVWGGALRIYRPGMLDDPSEAFGHPVIPFPRLRSPETALRAVQAVTVPLTASRRPPAAYAREIRALPGFPGARPQESDQGIETLYDELEKQKESLETQLEESRSDLEERELDREIERVDFVSAQRELQSVASRVSRLQKVLAESDQLAYGDQGDDDVAREIQGCEDAVKAAEESLPRVSFSVDVSNVASGLDADGKAEIWGNKAWRAFQSFERYANLKHESPDACGDFRNFSSETDQDAARLPDQWIAMQESEQVDANQRYRQARIFPVPAVVSASGEVYMPAHIKIQMGKPPAPRIHFYDDTLGSTGKIWVGHFGEHLPSPATN